MKYAFWDLDGTLLNTTEGVLAAYRTALEKVGRKMPGREVMKQVFGPTLEWACHNVLDIHDDDEVREIVNAYRDFYIHTGAHMAEIYPGIRELTEETAKKGVRHYMATLKPQNQAETVTRIHKLDFLDGIFGVDVPNGRDTKQKVLDWAIGQLGIAPAKAVMIGDRDTDIRAAQALGVPSVAVLYGFGSREEMTSCQADYVVEDTEELRRLLIGLAEEK